MSWLFDQMTMGGYTEAREKEMLEFQAMYSEDPDSDSSSKEEKPLKEGLKTLMKEYKDLKTNPPHYKQGSSETWDYIVSNRMGYLEGNIIKYVTRFRNKNGIEDLKKALAYLEKLIEVESK